MESLEITKLASKHIWELKKECETRKDVYLVVSLMSLIIEGGIILREHDRTKTKYHEKERVQNTEGCIKRKNKENPEDLPGQLFFSEK